MPPLAGSNAQCGRAALTWVTLGFGGPSVAHTTNPSKIDTAANRKENPLMGLLACAKVTVVLGFPAGVGAAAARLILGVS